MAEVVRISFGIVMVKTQQKLASKDLPFIDIRQSPGFAMFMRKTGWKLERIGQTNVFYRQVPLFGSVMRVPRPNFPLPLKALEGFARKKRALMVRVEPNVILDKESPLQISNYKKDDSLFLPTATIWIDLTKSETALWSDLDKDTRNLVRKAAKDSVIVKSSNDMEAFYKIWAENAKQKKFFVPYEKEMQTLWDCHREKYLLAVEQDGQMVAGALMCGYKKSLYYQFAASTEAGRKTHAPYAILWEVIKRGKKLGYKRLDLEGVIDPRVKGTSSWSGLTHFKKGFGGVRVTYVGGFISYPSLIGKLVGIFF